MLLWFVSYRANRALIDQTASAYKEYQEAATVAGPYLTETMIEDRSFHKILPLLDRLRHLPAGFATHNVRTPWAATYGLSQRERLQSASENLYRTGLERMFRSRLLFRLEELLDARINDPGFVYDALKVYLMLGGQQPADLELIKGWMHRDWASLYPGAANAPAVQRLEEHLAALFQLAQGDPLIELDRRLISEGQKTLARLSIRGARLHVVKVAIAIIGRRRLASLAEGRLQCREVFETTDRQPLDYHPRSEFFTYNGFYSGFIGRLADVSERLKTERWVLGDAARDTAVAAQFDNLPNQIARILHAGFFGCVAAGLGQAADAEVARRQAAVHHTDAIGAPSSPLKQLLVSIADETALTRERPAAQGRRN
jgi:type VI secretion system protein ImpL